MRGVHGYGSGIPPGRGDAGNAGKRGAASCGISDGGCDDAGQGGLAAESGFAAENGLAAKNGLAAESGFAAEGGFCVEDGYARAEDRMLLEELLSHLPTEQREVILLRFYGNLKLSEITEILGVNLSTVKSRLRLGLKKMKHVCDAEVRRE